MKNLTLNQAWTLCLEQWAWIIEQLDAGSKESIADLKAKWIDKEGYKVHSDCFFCQYDPCTAGSMCQECPGILVSPKLKHHWCTNKSYCWCDKPRKFYAKLLELNEKRKQ